MYGYFGGVTSLRIVLPYTGYLQLILGIALDGLFFLKGNGGQDQESTGCAVAIILLLRYAQLFTEELRTGSQQKSSTSSQISSVEQKEDIDGQTAELSSNIHTEIRYRFR